MKVRFAFRLGGVLCAIALVFMGINGAYRNRGYQIAQNKWNLLTPTYNDTQFSRLSTVSMDYIKASPANMVLDTYNKIESFTYENEGSIPIYEVALLVELLEQKGNEAILPERVDTILKNAEPSSFRDISTSIIALDVTGESIGYELATAIYKAEVSKKEIVSAFHTLEKYKNNEDFRNAVVKLKNVLNYDEYIAEIQEATGMSRQNLLDFFAGITK